MQVFNTALEAVKHSKGLVALVYVTKATEIRVDATDLTWKYFLKTIFKQTKDAENCVAICCTHADRAADDIHDDDYSSLDTGEFTSSMA